jgi:hypothetical protein
MKRLKALAILLDRVSDVACVVAGVTCLTIAGFLASPRVGFATLGVCLIGLPVLFSYLLPLLVRRRK